MFCIIVLPLSCWRLADQWNVLTPNDRGRINSEDNSPQESLSYLKIWGLELWLFPGCWLCGWGNSTHLRSDLAVVPSIEICKMIHNCMRCFNTRYALTWNCKFARQPNNKRLIARDEASVRFTWKYIKALIGNWLSEFFRMVEVKLHDTEKWIYLRQMTSGPQFWVVSEVQPPAPQGWGVLGSWSHVSSRSVVWR